MSGKCVILSAPSGSGKTTLVHHLLREIPELQFSVSACSRSSRPNEEHGKDYYFHSPLEFKEKIAAGEFLEWEEVYQNQFYGTLQAEVQRIWENGAHVAFDVDVKGGVNLKEKLGDKALAIFVKAPSMEILEARLTARGSEDADSLDRRLAKVREEMAFEEKFDHTIVNDQLDLAREELTDMVRSFLKA